MCSVATIYAGEKPGIMRDYLHFFVNGQECQVRGAEAFQPLSSYLRNKLGLTGTKVVCEEGDCGACTVLAGRLKDGTIVYKPINSCIHYVFQADLSHIITIEGLKNQGKLNAVQESMVAHHGAQCGFCTPGIIVTLYQYLSENKEPDCQGIKNCLTGNLCRCTGYEPIIKAGLQVKAETLLPLTEIYPQQNLIDIFGRTGKQSAAIASAGKSVFIPASFEEASTYKAEHPGSVIIAGGTDICVNMNKRAYEPESMISLANLSELADISVSDGMLTVGAAVTMSELENYFSKKVPEFHLILRLFGSPQIRNAATLAGNIANASPIGDTPPFLLVMDAVLELKGSKGTRQIRINDFYKGYKQFDLAKDEFIKSIAIPLPRAGEIIKLYKVSRRKHLDIATNSAAFRLSLQQDTIKTIAIAYGGVAPVILRLPKTEAFLTGKALTLKTMQAAGEIAVSEISPIDDVRGSKAFRRQLAKNLMLKLYYDIQEGRVAVCQP